jgi:hypothetical protein
VLPQKQKTGAVLEITGTPSIMAYLL